MAGTAASAAGWQPFRLGVPYLDRFEEQVVRCGDPQWAAWLVVRYAELLAGYLYSPGRVGESTAPTVRRPG
jgi:hypothetical protein